VLISVPSLFRSTGNAGAFPAAANSGELRCRGACQFAGKVWHAGSQGPTAGCSRSLSWRLPARLRRFISATTSRPRHRVGCHSSSGRLPLYSGIVARVAPGLVSATLLKVHAALYTVLVITKIIMAEHHHGNIIPAVARLLDWIENVAVLTGDAIAIALAWRRSRVLAPARQGPASVYVGLTIFLLAGWYTGLQAWSSAFRPKLIAAAEAQALDQPYCIEVDGHPVRTANDLTGLGMRATKEAGFHALLVIGYGKDRTYQNWSYRSGRFEPVNDHARYGLNLDFTNRCKPVEHFAVRFK
jgi:hypothetical protein